MEQEFAVIEEQYQLPERIFKNTFTDVWEDLLKNKGLSKEYKLDENGYLPFINSAIREERVSVDDVNKILEKGLSFGRQKDVQIYNIEINSLYTKENLLQIIDRNFKIRSVPYNNLAQTFTDSHEEYECIGYVDIQVNEHSKFVNKLSIIFAKQVLYKERDGREKLDNSYFPIDIDFINKKMIVKYYDKNHLKGELRGEDLASKFANHIIRILNINMGASNQTKYQRALYNICDHILNSVINEKSNLILENIDEIVEECSKTIKDKLLPNVDVDNLLVEHEKDIFNVQNQINKLIENICISKIIYEATSSGLMSIDGLISYITYKESGSVRATLQKPKKFQNLVDSQSYLNLRSVLDETKFIEGIKIIWNSGDDKQISLRYDASKKEYITIKFYRKFGDEELKYAIRRWEDFIRR